MLPPKGERVLHRPIIAAPDATGQTSSAWSGPAPLTELLANPALQASAESLEASSFLPTQSPSFLAALSETMLAGSDGLLLTAQAGPLVIGALALCSGAGWLRRWRQAGVQELHEPVDALCDSPEAARLLAEALVALPDPVTLGRLPRRSLLIPALRTAAPGKAWLMIRPAKATPTIALDPGWSDPASRFNSRRRSDLRRAVRRAEALGAVSYELISPDAVAFPALFDEAVRVEARGWKQQAGTAMACDQAKLAFFRCFLAQAAERGILRIGFMRIDGQAAAMQLALEYAGRFWLFKIGYDEAYARCSPGTLLMLHTLGEAARRGNCAYELLGEDEGWIEDLWTHDKNACLRLQLYPRSWRGMAALALDGRQWLRERLRRKRP